MSNAPTDTAQNVVVDVAPDQLTASLKLPKGGEPPTEEEILTALATAEVVVDDAVQKRVGEFVSLVESGEYPQEAFVVATGQPAKDGKDEEFMWDASFEKQKADWQGDAQINYYSISSIVTVEENQTIGTISPLVPPTDGVDVRGNAIRSKHKPVRFELDKTLRVTSDDPPQVISNVAGRVVHCDRKLTIEEVLIIPGDVSFETGNIDSSIDVHVKGAVPDRFEARSAKSITVGATIEAAIVETQGDVVVRGGIVGRDQGRISARGQIVAKFCSEADLTADGDVKIGRQLMNSKVRTKSRLIAERSALIGGHVYAAHGMDVAVLGSESDTPTRIFVGICPEVLAECAAIDEGLQPIRAMVSQIRTKVQPLLNNLKRLTPTQREQATELIYKAQEEEAKIIEQEARRDRLLQMSAQAQTARVCVSSIVHPRVTISIGRRVVTFRDELKGPIMIEERRIVNVTEVVAVNQLTGSVEILKAQQLSIDELMCDFRPLLTVANATGNG